MWLDGDGYGGDRRGVGKRSRLSSKRTIGSEQEEVGNTESEKKILHLLVNGHRGVIPQETKTWGGSKQRGFVRQLILELA